MTSPLLKAFAELGDQYRDPADWVITHVDKEDDHCLCGHKIVERFYIRHNTGRVEIIGNVCIKQLGIRFACVDCGGRSKFRSKRCAECADIHAEKMYQARLDKAKQERDAKRREEERLVREAEEERQRQYNKDHPERMIGVRGGYDHRRMLKGIGMKWNPNTKLWWIVTRHPEPIEVICKRLQVKYHVS